MEKLKFDYGKSGLEIKLNSDWNYDIFRPIQQDPLQNPVKSIQKSIKNPIGGPPLKKIIKQKDKIEQVCIVISDATRPVPSKTILKALISELKAYGIKRDQILILVATGLHRPSRREELKRMIGTELKNELKIVDHIATNKADLKYVGETSDNTPIFINKHYYESEIKILTGYVEPHFFFGFSGGRKSIVPGISGEKTIQANHSAKMINSPYARFGEYKKNPLHKNAYEIIKKVGVDFIVNVCINEDHKIIKVVSGDFEKAHKKLVNFQLQHVFREIVSPYDIVVCGNGGYPLDLNLYQAVKSMAIGELAVKEGGTIISVNELSDGVGIGQENFKELIFSGMSPKEIHQKVLNGEINLPDQWEIQILVRIMMRAEIYIISKLKADEIGTIGLKYAESVEKAIEKALKIHGNQAKILFLPNGPMILPKISR